MKYHTGSRFGLRHEIQSLIYFVCINVDRMPPDVQHRIVDAVQSVGGLNAPVLWLAVTTQDSLPAITQRVAWTLDQIDTSDLAKMVKKVYEILAGDLPQEKSPTGDPSPWR